MKMANKNKKKAQQDSYNKPKQDTTKKSTKTFTLRQIVYCTVIFVMATGCGYVHREHVSKLFESEKHFSHLSTLERELSFRTEMGLYYSYYKTIVEAPTITDGLHAIMNDNRTEYPLVINTLKRFNLYPEVVLAVAYRAYVSVCDYYKIVNIQCWRVERGEGLSPVQSCEGLGEPSYFYVECVFILHGLLMTVYFLFATYLSGSVVGGIITVTCIFYNHGECTRVMWTPMLRESFSYPFFVLQMFLVTHLLRNGKAGLLSCISIAVATICFILPWQFAQFTLLTQTVAVFGTYVLKFIDSHKVMLYLYSQAASLGVCYLLLFGNEMLLSSFYMSAIISMAIIVKMESPLKKFKYRIIIMIMQGGVFAVGTVCMKTVVAKLLQIADDAHVADILRSKFTEFKSFHTMLYTCAAEFDFMEKNTILTLTGTLVFPAAVLAVVVCLISLLVQAYRRGFSVKPTKSVNHETERKSANKPDAEIVFHLLQLTAFTAMAVIIMRLKLFWTPHLCLIASLLASRKLFGWIRSKELHFSLLAVLLGCMTVHGYQNLRTQMAIVGEYSNLPMEQLIEWINVKAPPGSVFAGPMPTMATVKLCTQQYIVNHPHYEDVGIRERTKKVYTMFSRKSAFTFHQNMMDLKVDYAIMEYSWCHRRSKAGCSLPEIWDLEDAENRDKPPMCELLTQNSEPYFKKAFQNKVFLVLRVVNGTNK